MPGWTRLRWRQAARTWIFRRDCFFSWAAKLFSPFIMRRQPLSGKNLFWQVGKKGNVLAAARNPLLPASLPTPGKDFYIAASVVCNGRFLVRPASFAATQESHFSYIFIEDDPARRADLCRACRRYLKTIVISRLTHALYLPLEEFVTVDLDALLLRHDMI